MSFLSRQFTRLWPYYLSPLSPACVSRRSLWNPTLSLPVLLTLFLTLSHPFFISLLILSLLGTRSTYWHDGTWLTFIILWSIFSLMKCHSISRCFVLPWWTGLFTMLIAALLSQYPHGVVGRNSDFIQHSLEPYPFINTMCPSSEFCFCTTPSHNRLFLASPSYHVPYKCAISCSWFPVR